MEVLGGLHFLKPENAHKAHFVSCCDEEGGGGGREGGEGESGIKEGGGEG